MLMLPRFMLLYARDMMLLYDTRLLPCECRAYADARRDSAL